MFKISEERRRSFRFNLLIVVLLCIVCYVLFFASLGFITRHGQEIKVPDVTSRDVKSAKIMLEKMDFDVDVDSAYDPKAKPFVVLSQMPEVNAVVKKGRTVFLTINKAEPPLTPMPNLMNLSFRSASMILKSQKLMLGDTSYKPDIAKGAVLEQLYKGQPIRPGQMVPQGSRIDLVIGDGLGNTEFNVPDVIGMPYQEAATILGGTGLHFTTIWEGEITDSAAATVYNQSPKPMSELGAPNRIKEGDIIDIFIKQEATVEELEYNRNPTAVVE
ncbi:PASTA domain-containing protein [Polluticoccus soli]|uniref:PASTA domain-containing protein n=1 Tax=Polluticoccus soli TaxID=3034150 RepID=UPI0023E32749|nr:PASTA domain-containing protein [Flavipsychrobacter sp. JY13-12]